MEAVGIRLSGRHIVGARTSEWKLLKEADGRRRLHNLTDGPLQQKRNLYGRFPDVAHRLEDYIEAVNSQAISAPEMTPSDEVLLEKHLRALGYLE